MFLVRLTRLLGSREKAREALEHDFLHYGIDGAAQRWRVSRNTFRSAARRLGINLKKTYDLDEYDPDTVECLFQLVEAGYSVRQIVKKLDIPYEKLSACLKKYGYKFNRHTRVWSKEEKQ